MKYVSSLIAVKSMAISRPFYEGTMGLQVAFDHGINLAFTCGLALQEQFGTLAGFPEEQTVFRAYNGELYFETEDLDADVARLNGAGVEVLHAPKEYPWGQRVFRFYDPDGYLIELGESMESVILRYFRAGMSDAQVAEKTMHPMEYVLLCKATL